MNHHEHAVLAREAGFKARGARNAA
jgi:hypothetical protein